MSTSSSPEPDRLDAPAYAVWAVLRRNPGVPAPIPPVPGLPLGEAVAAIESGSESGSDSAAGGEGVTVRGIYDVSGLRSDADLMFWLTGPTADGLQQALRTLRRSPSIAPLLPTWNAMGVHREAEFSRSHAPAFLRGLPPLEWVTVYPFVRSYEWYLLPEEERRVMLGDHGRKGSEYPQVQANTVASFALGDYEWILALEAADPIHLVDLMRHLRNTEARRHVREEIPFFTGRRISVDEVPEVLS